MSKPTTSYGNPTPEEGPWPECVGQTGEWCMDYIAGWVSYAAHKASQNGATRQMNVINIVRPHEHNENRVWIHVDDGGNILAPPKVG